MPPNMPATLLRAVPAVPISTRMSENSRPASRAAAWRARMFFSAAKTAATSSLPVPSSSSNVWCRISASSLTSDTTTLSSPAFLR